jgi:DNA-binding transcriptional ArsR family regulator
MSVQALSWAFKQPIEHGPKFVLVALANYASEDGECWPSQATIARMTGMDPRTVRRHLADLEQGGYLVRSERKNPDGGRATDIYRLTPPGQHDQGGVRAACPGGAGVVPANTKEDTKEQTTKGEAGKGKPARPPKWWESDPLYPQFQQAWTSLPERRGGDDKGAAFKAYRARLKEGVAHEEMLAGAQAYAIHCDETGKTETEFVMQGRTFFGPARRWEAYLPESP